MRASRVATPRRLVIGFGIRQRPLVCEGLIVVSVLLRRLGYLLYLLVSAIPLVVLSRNGSTDAFLFQHVSSVVTIVGDPSVRLESTFFRFQPGAGALETVLALVTGIQPQSMLFLPLAGLLYLVLLPAFFRCLVPTPWALVGSVAVAWSWLMPANYSIWPHTFGFLLYPAFVATYMEYAKRRTISRGTLLVTLFIAIHFFSYTAELWVLTFTLVATLILAVGRRHSIGFALPGLFLTLFIGFNQAVYHSFFPSLSTSLESGRYAFTTEYFLSTIFGFSNPEGYAFSPPRIPLLSMLEWTRFLLYSLPLLGFLGLLAGSLLRERLSVTRLAHHASIETTTAIALAAVWAANVLAYVMAGSTVNAVVTGYLYFVGPFLSCFVLGRLLQWRNRTNRRTHLHSITKAQGGHAVSCATVSIIAFTIAISLGTSTASPSQYRNVEGPAAWLFSHAEGIPIVTDHYTMGKILLVATENGRSFELYRDGLFYDEQLYGRLVDLSQEEPQPAVQYLYVLNLEIAAGPTSGDNWNNYQPLKKYLQQIGANVHLDRVYDGGSVLVLSY